MAASTTASCPSSPPSAITSSAAASCESSRRPCSLHRPTHSRRAHPLSLPRHPTRRPHSRCAVPPLLAASTVRVVRCRPSPPSWAAAARTTCRRGFKTRRTSIRRRTRFTRRAMPMAARRVCHCCRSTPPPPTGREAADNTTDPRQPVDQEQNRPQPHRRTLHCSCTERRVTPCHTRTHGASCTPARRLCILCAPFLCSRFPHCRHHIGTIHQH